MAETAQDREAAPTRKRGGWRALWRKIRKPLAKSRFVKGATVSLLTQFVRLVGKTNRLAEGSLDLKAGYQHLEPTILALWHGQHLLTPAVYPSSRPLVAMVSRSADAELNAQVVERFGIETVRGSGGRDPQSHMDKGGAKALIQLKRSLDAGKNVCMIADIPHGTPREAGQGIILLARLSGRPILPVAIATSRRKVLEKTWDKTTINLPFGQYAIVAGEAVWVDKKADEAEIEKKRQALTATLNEATDKAYRIVDGER
ncbi:MAG: lysophospholipid acyltransferase family protein [Rhizobiaceae bacterium]